LPSVIGHLRVGGDVKKRRGTQSKDLNIENIKRILAKKKALVTLKGDKKLLYRRKLGSSWKACSIRVKKTSTAVSYAQRRCEIFRAKGDQLRNLRVSLSNNGCGKSWIKTGEPRHRQRRPF